MDAAIGNAELKQQATTYAAARDHAMECCMPDLPADIQAVLPTLEALGDGCMRQVPTSQGPWWSYLWCEGAKPAGNKVVKAIDAEVKNTLPHAKVAGFKFGDVKLRPVKEAELDTEMVPHPRLAVEDEPAPEKPLKKGQQNTPGHDPEAAKNGKKKTKRVATEADDEGPVDGSDAAKFCLCGCGAMIGKKSRFAMGHDARVHGWAKRFAFGDKSVLEGKEPYTVAYIQEHASHIDTSTGKAPAAAKSGRKAVYLTPDQWRVLVILCNTAAEAMPDFDPTIRQAIVDAVDGK